MKDLRSYMPGEKIRHSIFGTCRLLEINEDGINLKWRVKLSNGDKKWVNIQRDHLEEMDAGEYTLTLEEIKDAVREILEEDSSVGETSISDKWRGGKITFEPGNKEMAGYELPIDTFFHKIVMIRDKLRVLEQKINSHKGLTDDEKVDIQQYVTKCYGSLTSFNILFRSREEGFVGQKGTR